MTGFMLQGHIYSLGLFSKLKSTAVQGLFVEGHQ